MVAFCFTALGSLMAIPADEWGVRFAQLGAQKATAITGVKETWVLYIFVRLMVIMSALALMTLLVEGVGRGSLPSAGYLLLCFVGSYCLVIVLGLGEYFGLLSLSGLRSIATGVKADGTPLRLQSIFGHPAWCAMYISALAPAVVVLFGFQLRTWIRNILVIGLLVLGEYVLILTFARGGWLSYPFTLVAIWGCVYAIGSNGARRVREDVRWGLWRKILISLPTTLVLSVGIMIVSEQGNYGRYVERLKAVSHATDRTVYIDPALRLAKEHPALGGGVGSFAYWYANHFVMPSGQYFSPGGGPLNHTFNNAHSLWFGLLVEQGYLGVFSLLAILLAIAWSASEAIKKVGQVKTIPESDLIMPLAWIATLCCAVSLGVYGLFDDTFYSASNVVVLFLMAGLAIGASRNSMCLGRNTERLVLWLLVLGFLAQFFWEFIAPGKGRHLTIEPGADGCYRKPQEISAGRFGVWCSEHAELELPVLSAADGQKYAALEMLVPLHGGGNTEVTIGVPEKSESFSKYHIMAGNLGQPLWVVVPLAEGLGENGRFKFDIHLSEYLVPLRNPKLQSMDRRRLAFGISEMPAAFSENAGTNARCIEIPTGDAAWRDFWCAGGGQIPIPLKLGQKLDVSVGLVRPPDVGALPDYLAYSTTETLGTFITPLTDGNRKVIVRGFDPSSPRGLRISSSRPASELDPKGGLGFVVGFRAAQD
jgi:O-antigen ligase